MKGEAEKQKHVINVRFLMVYDSTKCDIISKVEEERCTNKFKLLQRGLL